MRAAPPQTEFHCITEDRFGGWWNKMLLFEPDRFAYGTRVLYFDLDTVVLAPTLVPYLDPALPFMMLRRADPRLAPGSGVMAFTVSPKTDQLFVHWMSSTRSRGHLSRLRAGDQQFISQYLAQRKEPTGLWQQRFPRKFLSVKHAKLVRQIAVPDADIVYFHGFPRPHHVRYGWIPSVWRLPSDPPYTTIAPPTLTVGPPPWPPKRRLAPWVDEFKRCRCEKANDIGCRECDCSTPP